MRIGEPAKASGVRTRSLRYPEEQGLLPAERLGNGYREWRSWPCRPLRPVPRIGAAGWRGHPGGAL
ncbi:MerR family DNA-binding transcriptional regulator [Streptomyces collinus]